MSFAASAIFEAAALASSLSIDSFTAGFAYGTKKIKIPFLSVQIINFICSGITGLSLLIGSVISRYMPSWLTVALAFAVLFIIGTAKLLDSITKSIIREHSDINKMIKVSMFNFKFILNLYADPEKADVDESKVISSNEAAALALSLSLDGIAVGFGAALVDTNGLAVFLWSLGANATAVILGCRLGNKIADKLPYNISWISGVVLIFLAFSKLT